MDDAARVDGAERRQHVDGNGHRLLDAQRAAFEVIAQRLAFEQLHGDEERAAFFADFVDLADVRMVDAGGRAGLAPEAPACRLVLLERQHHLQRHGALQPFIVRLIHDAHSAGAELAADRVVADARWEAFLNSSPEGPAGDPGGGGAPFSQRYRPPSHPVVGTSTGSSATTFDHTPSPIDVRVVT